MDFKKARSLEDRKAEYQKMIKNYPDRVPIILERSRKTKANSDLPDLPKHKFLVPRELTVGQLLQVVRTKIQLKPSQGLFVFVNDLLPPNTQLLGVLHDQLKDEDGFLYVTYAGENTFGAQYV